MHTKSEGMEQLAESGCHFSRRLHTNMQIQVGFSFQEKSLGEKKPAYSVASAQAKHGDRHRH